MDGFEATLQTFRIENTCPEGQIDEGGWAADDGAMSEVISATPRRSSRAFHKMRVQAQGRAHDRKKFKEMGRTGWLGARGGRLPRRNKGKKGERVGQRNPKTKEEKKG